MEDICARQALIKLANNLKVALSISRITQKELAEKSGVNYIYISKMKNGQYGDIKPPLDKIAKLAAVLNLKVGTLVDGRIEEIEEEIYASNLKKGA